MGKGAGMMDAAAWGATAGLRAATGRRSFDAFTR